MREFKKGQFVKFAVVGKVEKNNKYYIYLSDGYIHSYRVSAYDYQAEWEDSLLPDFMNCYVTNVDSRGLPFLVQSRKEVLETCYPSPDFYPFKLLAIEKDGKTNALFYQLKDPFGIYHRFYLNDSNPNKAVNDIVSFWVDGIEEKENNLAFLKLQFKENINTSDKQEVDSVEMVNLDPRLESQFGFESNKVEFKSSIVFPAGELEANIDKQLQIIAKTIAGFQNADGGVLYIGINDSGNVSGIKYDYPFLNSSETDYYVYQANKDGYENKIRVGIKYLLGNIANSKVHIEFDTYEELEYCILKIERSDYPIYMQGVKIFQRVGNMTQLLLNDEITYFIESRLSIRLGSLFQNRNMVVEDTTDEDKMIPVIEDGQLSTYPDKVVMENDPIDFTDIWIFINFFKNGNWTFTKKIEKNNDIERVIPIPKKLKKGFLAIGYTNGRVNIVSIQDLISPKRKGKNRKMRPVGKIYKTGWNTETKILDVIVAKPTDLLIFKSRTDDNKEWIKIHKLKDISVHDINAKGNILINEKFDNAKIMYINRLPIEYYPHISGLLLKSHQTSGSLGYTTKNRDFVKTINLLNKILTNLYPENSQVYIPEQVDPSST